MESQKSVQTFTYFTPSLRVLSHGLGISHNWHESNLYIFFIHCNTIIPETKRWRKNAFLTDASA